MPSELLAPKRPHAFPFGPVESRVRALKGGNGGRSASSMVGYCMGIEQSSLESCVYFWRRQDNRGSDAEGMPVFLSSSLLALLSHAGSPYQASSSPRPSLRDSTEVELWNLWRRFWGPLWEPRNPPDDIGPPRGRKSGDSQSTPSVTSILQNAAERHPMAKRYQTLFNESESNAGSYQVKIESSSRVKQCF